MDLSSLSGLAPELVTTFVSVASDIALVVDANGVILTVATGEAQLTPQANDWVGRQWIDTVTAETRTKIEQLLHEASVSGVSRRREVNHPSPSGTDIPIAYSAVRLGENGPVLASGRDLRAVSAIQQRFMETQREMERDYWKLRQAESRYRLLFQVATDAVLVVDASTMAVIDVNRAAEQLFGIPREKLVGENVTVGMDRRSRPMVEELLASARSTGKPTEMRAQLSGRHASIIVSATPLRGETSMLLLVRARSLEHPTEPAGNTSAMLDLLERTPDAVVITDSSGHVLMVNATFLLLCGVTHESLVKGRLIGEWVDGRPHGLVRMFAEVRNNGIANLPSASLRLASGRVVEVEMSATLMTEGDQECVGISMRRLVPESIPALGQAAPLADAIGKLVAQVGAINLPDLIREASMLAERHLIQAALERTEGHEPTAAELLGVQLDSLRLRKQRLGLPQNPPDGDPSART